jgi:hypothetical protein
MTKVVQGIGDAIGNVVKGVVNVVKGVADGIGDLARGIADSPIGKAILIAGAVYFGGAALAGGFGSSAAGGSFFSGMGTGVASAAETLSGAWSSTLAGNFGEAASSIGNAFGTAGTAGGNSAAMTQALQTGAGALTSSGAALSGAAAPAGTGLTAGGTGLTAGGTGLTAGGSAGQGLVANGMSAAGSTVSPYALVQPASTLASTLPATLPAAAPAASWWAGVNPYLKTAAVMGGTQVVGGLISGAGQASAAQDARDEAERIKLENIARYNENTGTLLNFSPFARPATPQYSQPPPQPRYYPQPTAVAPAPTGMVARYMG